MTMIYSLLSEIQNSKFSRSTTRQTRALERIIELFSSGSGSYSAQQIELFDEVFRALTGVIELKTRIRLAERVAPHPDTPAALARALASDEEIAVAGPVLSQSLALSDLDLASLARTQSQDHLYSIAQRQVLSEPVTDILVERGECEVVRAVAKNTGARISEEGFRGLVLKAAEDSELALHIGLRSDVPRHHFMRLLEVVSVEVCNRIVAGRQELAKPAREALTEVIDEINSEIRSASVDHRKAKKKVRRLNYWKELGEGKVHAAARAQDFEQAVLALSILARCSIEVAERAVLHENVGAVQIVGKAAGCSWATVKALLLMRAADRRLSKLDLDRARAHYERLEVQTAKRVLEFYESKRDLRPAANSAALETSAITIAVPTRRDRQIRGF